MTLATLAQSQTPPYAFCGIGIGRAGRPDEFHISTAPGIQATEHSLFRAASISKIVAAQTLLAAGRVGENPRLLDTPIADLLGIPFHHPGHPATPLTLRMLLSHTAGLDDAAGYLIPAGTGLPDWLAAQGGKLFLPHKPGTYFSYSNLGYILLAAAAEVLGGQPFDALTRTHVLDPLTITGGFNWAGVSAQDWQGRLGTYRRDGTDLMAQIDGPTAARPLRPDYHLVRDIGQLSPQGGLRISLAGMLQLARSLAQADPTPLWSPDMGAGDTLGGVFESYGAGLQIFGTPRFYPRPLIGHFANAYGFSGGVWWDKARNAAFCYALNGLPMGDDSDAFRAEELAIFQRIASEIAAT